MNQTKKKTNPFYVLLVITGVAFCLTACAFGMLMLRDMQTQRNYAFDDSSTTASEASFVNLVDKYAVPAMVGELAVLAVATFGAIGLDSYWTDEKNA